MTTKELPSIMLSLFGILIMGLTIVHTQTTQYSGGLYLGETLYDMTGNVIIGEFPPSSAKFEFLLNYLEVWLEEDWYYFAYLNKTSCYIARSRPDFSDFELVTKSTPTHTCQFAIDKVNSSLYYVLGNNLMKSEVNGENAQILSSPIGNYYNDILLSGAQIDVATGAIWYFGSYETNTRGDYFSFYVYYPNNTNVAWPLPVLNSIQNFIIFNETLFWFDGYYFYQCIETKGECAPGIKRSANNLAFDTQTKGVYYLSTLDSRSSSVCNFYYTSPNGYVCYTQSQNPKADYYFTILPMKCEKGCSSKGNCIETNSQFNCSCFQGYAGPSCDIYCDSSVNCTNNGNCNVETGACDCNVNYYGSNCAIYCDKDETCTENGNCTEKGKCICNEYYSGTNCTVPVISPTTPSYFSANALLSDDQTKLIVYYSYQDQQLVLNFTSYLIYKEFNSGFEFNVSSSSCVKSELYFTSLPLIQPTSTSHLTYWNGTANECVDGSISKWVDDVNTPKSNLTLLQDCSSPTQYLPSFVEWNPYSLVFDVSSFSYSPPSSIFKIPSICFNN